MLSLQNPGALPSVHIQVHDSSSYTRACQISRSSSSSHSHHRLDIDRGSESDKSAHSHRSYVRRSSERTGSCSPILPPGLTRRSKLSRSVSPMPRQRDVKCWYFLYGNCKFGNRCVNSHTRDPTPTYLPSIPLYESVGYMPRRPSPTASYASSSMSDSSAQSGTLLPSSLRLHTRTGQPLRHHFEADEDVISIPDALLLDMNDENRMLAFLDKHLRQFVTGAGMVYL